MLPRIVDSSGVLGPATLLPGAPVLAGLAGDQQASLIGQGCTSPGSAKITFGTGGMLDVCTGPGKPAVDGRGEAGSLPLPAWRRDGRLVWALEGLMLSAGTCVEWLRDEMGLLSSVEESDAVAASCSSTGGAAFVPALNGMGTPLWDFGARGALLGLSRGVGRAQVVRAVLEGVAHRGADLVEAAEADSGLTLSSLRVDGGMTANATFLQALADATSRPVEVSPVLEATTLGAGFLAGMAVGLWRDEDEVAAAWSPRTVVEPAGPSGRETWLEAREPVPALGARAERAGLLAAGAWVLRAGVAADGVLDVLGGGGHAGQHVAAGGPAGLGLVRLLVARRRAGVDGAAGAGPREAGARRPLGLLDLVPCVGLDPVVGLARHGLGHGAPSPGGRSAGDSLPDGRAGAAAPGPWQHGGVFDRYVALGDSSTEGLDDPDGSGGYRGWADRLATAVAAVNPDLQYANLAVRGRVTAQVRAEQLEPALALRPDLATVFAGVNDVLRPSFDLAGVATDLEVMFGRLVDAGATVLTITAPDPTRVMPIARRLAPRIAALNATVRRVAASTGAVVVDVGVAPVAGDPRLWSADRLHANSLGHERIAAALAEALGLPGTDRSWADPLPPADPRTRRDVVAAELAWVRTHFTPWLVRRLRGKSSGDDVLPKRPELTRLG